MTEAFAIKEKDKPFHVVNAAAFRHQCDNLPAGRYRLTVEKMKRYKSISQLGYYYGYLLPASHKLLLDAGWEMSLDETDIFWKSQFAGREILNRHTGEMKTIPALKREMTTTDMMTFVDAIRSYCSEYLGCYLPAPGEQIEMFNG